jgi:hypothetical protein
VLAAHRVIVIGSQQHRHEAMIGDVHQRVLDEFLS